jgi:uncharacterized protein (TIGR02246 family)
MRPLPLVVCVLLLVTGCGGGTGEPAATTGPETPQGALVGQWTNTSERGTVKVLDLRSDGTFRLDAAPLGSPLAEVSTGTYGASSVMLGFETDSFCAQPGTYAWVQDGDEVTFHLEEDPCSSRVAVLNGYVFTPLGFPRLAEAMEHRGRALEQVVGDYEAARDARDLATLASVLSEGAFLFTEPGTTLRSADEFVAMMSAYLTNEVGGRDFRVFVGDGEILEAYRAWGFGGATPEQPLTEADVFTIAGGAITEIHILYGAEILEGTGLTVPTDLVARYASAWSSGDGDEIAALYTEGAVRTEGLYATSFAGRDAIRDYAIAFFERHPAATLTTVDPYVFGNGATADPLVGAVLNLEADRCQLPLAVLLETDGAGAITTERLFYDLAALEACGWRR